jgi:hypothetical protein
MRAQHPAPVHLVEVAVELEQIIALAILTHGPQPRPCEPRESLLGV